MSSADGSKVISRPNEAGEAGWAKGYGAVMGDGGAGTDDGYLRKVYGISDPNEIRDYYDDWAVSYDRELRSNGYVSPQRVAAALASHATGLHAPVLDYGCGTGLSGEELVGVGFSTVDGADPAERMLAVARNKGVYRSLVVLDLKAERPPFEPLSYAAVSAVGLIGPGVAPLSLFDQLTDLVSVGGLFGFSFNDHAMEDPAFSCKVSQVADAGAFEVLSAEHGPHISELGVGSMVYVLRRIHA